MSQALTEARLTVAKSRIDNLEEDARGAGEEKSRIDRHLEALRKAHASASAAAHAAGNRIENTLEELGMKLTIAEHRRAAEVAGDRDGFVHAVEKELHAWDRYLEQLQERSEAGTAQATLSTGELRSRRNDVARRLGEVGNVPEGAWRERREGVFQALDELDHAAGTA